MKKILVIEDNDSIREEIVTILRLENFQVLEADNGQNGLIMARKELPDLIICDVMIPGIDGFMVLDNIRNESETSNIPVIILSALNSTDDLVKGAELGATEYLIKPFHPEDLLFSIRKAFSRKILVIEDTEAIREEICTILRFENFEVIEADNGQLGLELAKSQLPDLIICDIMLPVINGFQVLDEIRNFSLTDDIPLILLSALNSRDDLVKGAELGATEYLIKPFHSEELMEIINSYI